MSRNGTANRLMTAEEVAEYLHVHLQTVYLWAKMGRLPFLKLGRSVRFDKLALDQLIRRKIEENEARLLPWADDGCSPIGTPEPPFDFPHRNGGDR